MLGKVNLLVVISSYLPSSKATHQSSLAVPILVLMMENTREARSAPTFPQAAEKPWAKPRTRVGKVSDGMMKVDALAPKLKKNCSRE